MDRHIYKNNPLMEVVLQLRFPTILIIGTKDPADFQEAIRQDYPTFHSGTTNANTVMFSINPVNGVMPSTVQTQQIKNYIFISKDGKYKIDLTNSSISFSTLGYVCWEEFIEHFQKPLDALIKIYNPAFFERIGLRYIDGLSKRKLKVEDKAWQDLVDEKWLGILSIKNEKDVQISKTETEFYLDNKEILARVIAGLGKTGNQDENMFIIDCDVIKLQSSQVNEYKDVITRLHQHSWEVFNMLITDTTRTAME